MSIETYEKVMACLDAIEEALDSVAKKVGHCSFAEFTAKGKKHDAWEDY